MPTVLIVDDERTQLTLLRRLLAQAGYEVLTAEDGVQALEIVQSHPVHVVVTDIRMPQMSGKELLDRLRELDPNLPVIIMTAYPQLKDAVDLVAHAGAFYYIEKPIEDIRILTQEIERALEKRTVLEVPRSPEPEEGEPFEPFPGIVGSSPPMRRLVREMRKLLPILGGPATVLITGESGTGKELVARALHEHGPRRDRPFVPVHCAAIPHELMEAELFGAEKGAYTGATHSRPGYFEQAEGGTLFLDEIAEIPLPTQVKLLRVLSNREYYRVGSSRPRTANICVIAATNRNIEEEVEAGRFRDDLFYRLNVFRIHVPPLRERREDIPELVEYLSQRFFREFGLRPKRLTQEAIATLRRFQWPGNVRQLDHYIQQAIVMSDSEVIDVGDLPAENEEPPQEPLFLEEVLERGIPLEEVERQLILAALQRANGNQTQAARLLGVSRRKLQYRMEKHGIYPTSSRRRREDGSESEEE